jgi:hypothetical protein
LNTLNKFWFATVVPALVGFAFATLSIRCFDRYGWSLFVVLPILVSFLSAFCISYRRRITFLKAYSTSVASLLVMGAVIILFALDGLICLLMALPLALLLALIGAALGCLAGRACIRGAISAAPLLLLFLFPGLVAFEAGQPKAPPVRSVTTSVVVSAPIERVWDIVVAFPTISEPPRGIFRLGIAYPIEARIEGHGVGAIRYCTFSTGSFVEPITHWEPPSLLAFDVTACPEPMKELSLYQHFEAPHLHGYMLSRNGQFHLFQRDGQVVLEGTTWYTHSLYPQWYWGPISDMIIHQIHERVLNHIRRIAEAP